MTNSRIAIIGCGNLGTAIARGLIESGLPPEQIIATRRHTSELKTLSEQGVSVTSNNTDAVLGSDIVLLTVKPYNIGPVLEEIHDALTPEKIVVSGATGISIQTMADLVPEGIALFRAMPNTAADVKESLTCICHPPSTESSVDQVVGLFNSIGKTVVIDEDLMEAATVLGACGIAYVLRFIRGMIQGGIEIGFDAATATTIVSQTVKGAAELLITNKQHPEQEIDKVTTPRGCTIAGLNEMEHNGFSSSLIKGIVASYVRIEK